MKKKNWLILLLVLILIIIAAVLILNNRKTTFSKKLVNFAVKDTASVTKVFLADKRNNTILLQRVTTGKWLLDSTYKVRKSAIDLLLETMKNLTPKYPVPEKARDNIISQLAAQSTKVEVYQRVYRINLFDKIKLFPHEKLTKTYYVGGTTQDNMGNFMLMAGQDVPFVVHLLGLRGFVSPRYSTLEKDWRDHTIFKTKLYDIKKVTMQIPGDPKNSFEIDVHGDSVKFMRLSDHKEILNYDTLKVLNFLTSFADVRYEALLNDMDSLKRDSIIHSQPRNILTLIDNEGDTTAIKTFNKPNDVKKQDMEGNIYVYDTDRLYALVNKGRDFVLIQFFVFDRLLRPLSYFTEKPGKGEGN